MLKLQLLTTNIPVDGVDCALTERKPAVTITTKNKRFKYKKIICFCERDYQI